MGHFKISDLEKLIENLTKRAGMSNKELVVEVGRICWFEGYRSRDEEIGPKLEKAEAEVKRLSLQSDHDRVVTRELLHIWDEIKAIKKKVGIE